MTAPELKPCPFCGGEASISKDHDPGGNGAFYAVKCRKCRAKSPEIYAVETCNIHFAQVRDAWNRRADIAAIQPAQVRVKPLVWEEDTDPDSDDFRAFVARSPTLHLRYIVRKVYGGFWKLTGCVPFGTPNFLTLEAAKAAAQADYEARILALIGEKK